MMSTSVKQVPGKKTSKAGVLRWRVDVAGHDYAAARSYLSLNAKPKAIDALVKQLRGTRVVHFKAKDLLRGCGLPLLPRSNPDVAKELDRIAAGVQLSPCLIIRGQIGKGRVAQIADGYHRICAVNHVDEDAEVPVQIISA
ncbi:MULTISPECIES: hypothetical protein [Cryobacterium]|uniref:hypothetical protein n=1 Tax=Cryobacterium TaxID=69578 RepID=UPI001F53F3DD|nr:MULTISPECIES: hypothetical protein [Cryobacterium]